jgi:hypothetical protein
MISTIWESYQDTIECFWWKHLTWVRWDMAIASCPAPLTNIGAEIVSYWLSSTIETDRRKGWSSCIAVSAAACSRSDSPGPHDIAAASCLRSIVQLTPRPLQIVWMECSMLTTVCSRRLSSLVLTSTVNITCHGWKQCYVLVPVSIELRRRQ